MRPLRQITAALCLLASLGPGLSASGRLQANPSSPRPASATYRISGKVVDAHSGAAVARASVQIADVKERGQTRTASAADDGTFSFEGLARGKYSLTAERHGYVAQSYEEHDQYSTAIAVGPGLISENLTFRLTAEGLIAGTITDDAGEPVRSIQVRLFEDQDREGLRTTRQREAAMTDDRGMYEISRLGPGAYFLVVNGRPWYAQRLQPGTGNSAGENQPLDVAYPTLFYPGVTDQDAATPIPIQGGERIEANLTLAAQQALRLHVAAPPGGTRGGTSIMLNQTLFGQTENLPTQILANPDGSLEVTGVLPGHYDVTLTRFGNPVQSSDAEGGMQPESPAKHFDTDVTGGATELAEDNGVGEIMVSGKVTSPTGKLPRGGFALRTPHGRRQHYAALNGSGEFEIAAPPGSYEVVGGLPGMYIATMKASGASLSGRMLTLKSGDSPKLDIVVGSGLGDVQGTALLNAKPASGVMVLLAPEDPKNNQILFRRDQSDSDGTFTVQNVVPGKYRLLAIDKGWELEWANPAVLDVFLARSIPLEVKSGDHLNQKIEVQVR